MVFSDRSGAFGDPKPNLHDLNGKIASGRQLAKVLKLPIRLAKLQQEKPRQIGRASCRERVYVLV
jgi:uncharacterized membrane protein